MIKDTVFNSNNKLLAFAIITSFWIVFFLITGTITSGYHFTDDHEIISISQNIENNGLIEATKEVIKEDMNIRFRPFYYVHRVFLTRFFKTNFTLWSMYNGVLVILTSYILFLFINIQGYRFYHALLFSFLTLVGSQTAIWWRLGPTETIGIFMLSLALFFLANSIYKKKKYQLWISILFLLLASISKESFTLFIPAYTLLYLQFKLHSESRKTILNTIGDSAISLLLIIAMFIIELYIIVFVVGTNKIGYAGLDSFSISHLASFASLHAKHDFHIYLLIIIELLFLFLIARNHKTSKLSDIIKKKPYIYSFIILLAIILPQYILYYKSGLYERYLLPLNLGLSYFIIFLLSRIQVIQTKTLIPKRMFLYIFVSISLSIPSIYATYKAKKFKDEGVSTKLFLSSITSNTDKDDSILIVLSAYENFEWGNSIKKYLSIIGGRKQLYFLNTNTELNDEYSKNLNDIFLRDYKDVLINELTNEYSCIAILPNSANSIIKDQLDKNDVYKRLDFEEFTVYTRED